MRKKAKPSSILFLSISAAFLLAIALPEEVGAEQKSFRQEGQLEIYVAGKEIGREKYSIKSSGESIISSSTVSFHDPANKNRAVKIDTEMNLDNGFLPRTYQVRTDVGGQKGMLKATFTQGQASFEYLAGGTVQKNGLLIGDRFCVLDTNVFHHFVFIAQLFDLSSAEKSQSMEVIIPQELDNGLLKITNMGMDKVSIRGKTRDLYHLRADSGALKIDMWVDVQKTLYKVAMPTKRVEVVRD